MKKAFLILSLLALCVACAPTQEAEQENIVSAEQEESAGNELSDESDAIAETAVSPESLLGTYVGMFKAVKYKENKMPSYSNKITISIDSIRGDMLFGHSVVAGNMRPFVGKAELAGVGLSASVNEPGDDKYDGIFSLTIDGIRKNISGYWEAFKEDLAVTKRNFTLEKRTFSYDAGTAMPEDIVGMIEFYNSYDGNRDEYEMPTSDVVKFNASQTLLKKEDVANMYKGDLELIRNAIYARHGYSFKNRRMRYVFDRHVDWYMPLKTNVLAELTEVELVNIDLLKRYEDHAEKYYDYFGR